MTQDLSVEQIQDIQRAQEPRIDDPELKEADATSEEVFILCNMALASAEQPEEEPDVEAEIKRIIELGCSCDLMNGYLCGIHNAVNDLVAALRGRAEGGKG